MALRVAQSNAPQIGRSLAASPDRFSVSGIASVAAGALALGLMGLGPDLLGNGATSLLCLALLVFGLPHGSLDIAIIRRSAQLGHAQMATTVTIYLGLAAAMYAIWCLAPVLALGAFLLIATIHFSEDWTDRLPPFFAIGTAAALLTAPALIHHQAIAEIFISLTGQGRATVIADLSLLLAPIALIATGIGIALMIRDGHGVRGLETGTAILGMILLPPLVGFAIFFCLLHSPRHFTAARAEVGGHDGEAALLTGAAIGIAAMIYASQGSLQPEGQAIYASFVTLSVLTVPHMIVPYLANRRPSGD
jgi:beta-carotene 15,15'-dioxygenase